MASEKITTEERKIRALRRMRILSAELLLLGKEERSEFSVTLFSSLAYAVDEETWESSRKVALDVFADRK